MSLYYILSSSTFLSAVHFIGGMEWRGDKGVGVEHGEMGGDGVDGGRGGGGEGEDGGGK